MVNAQTDELIYNSVRKPVFAFKGQPSVGNKHAAPHLNITHFSVCLSVSVVLKVTYIPQGQQHSDPKGLITVEGLMEHKTGGDCIYHMLY